MYQQGGTMPSAVFHFAGSGRPIVVVGKVLQKYLRKMEPFNPAYLLASLIWGSGEFVAAPLKEVASPPISQRPRESPPRSTLSFRWCRICDAQLLCSQYGSRRSALWLAALLTLRVNQRKRNDTLFGRSCSARSRTVGAPTPRRHVDQAQVSSECSQAPSLRQKSCKDCIARDPAGGPSQESSERCSTIFAQGTDPGQCVNVKPRQRSAL